MWFRNARPYKLPGRLGIDASELSQRLSRRPFQPCRPSQPVSSGWVPALSDDASDYVHKSGDYWLIRLQREERLLPASVIRSEVNARIQEIQAGQGRRVQRKERLDIVDEVTQDLMPRAFTKSQYLEALINDREGWVWSNTASAARAEEGARMREQLERARVARLVILEHALRERVRSAERAAPMDDGTGLHGLQGKWGQMMRNVKTCLLGAILPLACAISTPAQAVEGAASLYVPGTGGPATAASLGKIFDSMPPPTAAGTTAPPGGFAGEVYVSKSSS